MPHKDISVGVKVFDTQHDRAEYWYRWLKISRSEFYTDAIKQYCYQLEKQFPKEAEGLVDFLHEKQKSRPDMVIRR
jgi:hypothetical protein